MWSSFCDTLWHKLGNKRMEEGMGKNVYMWLNSYQNKTLGYGLHIKGTTNYCYQHWGTTTVATLLISINCLSKWIAITKVCKRNVDFWYSPRENDSPTLAPWGTRYKLLLHKSPGSVRRNPVQHLLGTQPYYSQGCESSLSLHSLRCRRTYLWESSIPISLGAML